MVNFTVPVIFSCGRGHGLKKPNISKAQKTSDRIAQDITIQHKTPQVMTAPTAQGRKNRRKYRLGHYRIEHYKHIIIQISTRRSSKGMLPEERA